MPIVYSVWMVALMTLVVEEVVDTVVVVVVVVFVVVVSNVGQDTIDHCVGRPGPHNAKRELRAAVS